MKKILLLILCVSSCAVLAQQPSVKKGQNRNRMPEEMAAMKAKRVAVEQDAVGPELASNDSQEKFDEIMGSFSALAMKFSEQNSDDLDLFVYECQHISGEAFSRALEPFLSVHGELTDCEDSDLVIISDDRANLEKLKEIAISIDRPVRQVLVSASIVEFQIADGFEKDISLQYNQFRNLGALASTGGFNDVGNRILSAIIPSGGNPSSLSGTSSYMYYDPDEQTLFSAFITFLERNGTAQILSSPSLIMRRGHTGTILSGEDIPITESNVGSGGTSFSVEYKSVGIKLRVTPESIFDDRVVLEVSPEVSNIIRFEESPAGRNPVIAIRNASTMLEMSDGYMVSIGGLLREENIETKRQVPIIGSIPLLGALFRVTSSESIRSQLVIFLTVKILDPADLAIDTIKANGMSEQLNSQVQLSRESLPEKKTSIWGGIKRFFQ